MSYEPRAFEALEEYLQFNVVSEKYSENRKA